MLVPGAVLLFLRVDPDGWTRAVSPLPPWLLFGGLSYLVGQLLLAATEWINACAEPVASVLFSCLRQDVCAFREEATDRIALMTIGSLEARFHTALSYLRTKNAEAAAEVDHHMADYKLLRNLIAVLFIDLLAPSIASPHVCVLVIEFILLMACFLAFVRMFCWAELLAFRYVCLIADKPRISRVDKSNCDFLC